MRLIQFFLPGKGKRVGVIQGDRVLDITSSDEGVRCTLDLFAQGKTARGVVTRASWLVKKLHRRGLDWREIQQAPSRRSPHLLVPIDAPEVWGAIRTYAPVDEPPHACPASGPPRAQPVEPDTAADTRPVLFFKATADRVIGPHAPIAIRRDSRLTVPEAGGGGDGERVGPHGARGGTGHAHGKEGGMRTIRAYLFAVAAVHRGVAEIRRRRVRWTRMLDAAHYHLESGRPESFLAQRERMECYRRLEELDAIEAAIAERWND